MIIKFEVEVEVERTEGKFASKDELTQIICEWIENADEGQLEGENEGQYEVTNWNVVSHS